MLADSGGDAPAAFSTGSDYAANVEAAQAAEPPPRPVAAEALRKVDTPAKTCEDVAALMGIARCSARSSRWRWWAPAVSSWRWCAATTRSTRSSWARSPAWPTTVRPPKAEIAQHLGSRPGFLGPVGPKAPIKVVADREVAAMADFVVGANRRGFHLAGVNWGATCPSRTWSPTSATWWKATAPRTAAKSAWRAASGRPRVPARPQVFRAMGFTVLDETGKAAVPAMGCYGIGVSRIVAAAIEQNHDEAGIVWPVPMAPWAVAVCVINPKKDAAVDAAAGRCWPTCRPRAWMRCSTTAACARARCSPTSN